MKAQILSHSMFTTDLDPPWKDEEKRKIYFKLIQSIFHGYYREAIILTKYELSKVLDFDNCDTQ